MLEYSGQYAVEQDMAGKWRVLAHCGDESLSLKFQTEPTAADVLAVVLPVLTRRNAELEAVVRNAQPRRTYAKLDIRRAMRALGTEAQLDALLDASPMFRADWTDATEIDLADPVLAQALAGASIDVAAVKGALA